MSRYLKSIDLLGFKSFPVKTHLEFVDGITGIVGANGSGKSNVVEAIKWVLGEQSAKTLRGDKMEDVIFNGTKDRPAMGMGEVGLNFTNDNHWLAIDYEEVAIQRRMFRSGDSQYYINKSRIRLKDIVELFLDTGVGRDSYAIFEQGKIDRLLSESPTDRRSLFEDFAGISKFKFRKEEAEKKLENARQNLERINDIIIQLEKEVVSLKEQAENAAKYNDLKGVLVSLEMKFEALRVQNFEKEIESKYNQKKKTEEKLQPLTGEIKQKEESIAATEVDIQNREVEHNQMRDAHTLIERENAEVESRLKSNKERKELIIKQLESMAARLKEGEEREKTLRQELAEKSAELDAVAGDKDSTSGKMLDIQSRIDAIHAQIRQLDGRILDGSRELGFDRIISKDDIEKQKGDLIALQAKLENYRSATEEKFNLSKSLGAEAAEKTVHEEALRSDSARLKADLEKILSEIDAALKQETAVKNANLSLAEEVKQLQNTLRSMDRVIMESLEKQAVEIKEFKAKKPELDSRLDGSLQTLARSIEEGRAMAEISEMISRLKGDFADYKSRYESILGILYSDEGAYTQKEKTQASLEDMARRITENELEIERLRARTRELQSARENLQNSYNKDEFELNGVRNELRKLADQLTSVQTGLKELENLLNSASDSIQKKQTAIEKMMVLVDGYEEEMRGLKAGRNELFDDLNRQKIDFARIEEKYKSLNNEIGRIKNQTADIEKMKNSYRTDHENSVASIADLVSRIESDTAGLAGLAARIEASARSIEAKREEVSELNRSRKVLELQRHELEENIQRMDKVIFNLENIIAEKKNFVDSIIQNAREVYNRDVREIGISGDDNVDATAKKITELRGELTKMGEVNLLAIEQYHSASERHEFLQAQKTDAEKAAEDILKLINETNAKSIEQFKTAFEEIRKAFKKIFARLFDGGRADLILMDENDPLNSGINIMAEPPGKKFASVSLLSGGERALVAIAVIFAILYLKPTPFVVLDEMDAPLDDDNIERFKSLLSDFKQTSQFIIVSHSKSTLEICDALYGVTMEEQGVSKIVNVAFDEANILFKTEDQAKKDDDEIAKRDAALGRKQRKPREKSDKPPRPRKSKKAGNAEIPSETPEGDGESFAADSDSIEPGDAQTETGPDGGGNIQ